MLYCLQGVQGDGIIHVAALLCPCVLKALGSFETSQNCDSSTQCHISEDPNPQSLRCGKLKSVKSRRFTMASECRLMVGHGAEGRRRAEHRVCFRSSLSPSPYRQNITRIYTCSGAMQPG
jgi:hypothetical protein